MVDKDDKNPLMEGLLSVLEEYVEWHHRTVRALFYNTEDIITKPPQSFIDWIAEAEEKGAIDKGLSQSLESSHYEISSYALKFVERIKERSKPSLEEYDDFANIYNDFLSRAHRLEKQTQLADGGLDVETGFRSMAVFAEEVGREIERRVRSGSPFCIVAARVDDMDKITNNEAFHLSIKDMAESIRKAMRPYDDAYIKKDGEFFFCLKNTDFPGACKAITRINDQIKRDKITFAIGELDVQATLSCTILKETMNKDGLEAMAKNMMEDVRNNAEDKETILQYEEISELQRYIKGMDN